MSSAARQKAGSNPAAAPVWSAGPAGSGEGGRAAPSGWLAVKLQTKVREDFTIMKKAPTMAFSWLKVPTSAFTFKTLSRQYAKHVLTHSWP